MKATKVCRPIWESFISICGISWKRTIKFSKVFVAMYCSTSSWRIGRHLGCYIGSVLFDTSVVSDCSMETFSVLLTFMWSVRKKIVYFISFWHENLEHFFSSSFICTWLKTVWNSITKQLSRTFVPLNRWVWYNQISARVGRWSHAQTFSLKFTNHRNCALFKFFLPHI